MKSKRINIPYPRIDQEWQEAWIQLWGRVIKRLVPAIFEQGETGQCDCYELADMAYCHCGEQEIQGDRPGMAAAAFRGSKCSHPRRKGPTK
jgi:hypothetical protein